MEKIYTDPNMENENTEHIRGKRLSSILKAPRLPLDDLGNGNELTQDITIEKRRKTLRRVSFANTIDCRVFERDLKSNTAESTECSADTKSDVLLHQNEEPEAVPCEITGMNTLLHAPIQASVQQTEGQDADSNLHRANRHDSTVLFSEENEMDMTSSHTAVITGNLTSSQVDETGKIDITSFLAGLNSSNAKAETSKELPSFPDPTKVLCPAVEQKEDATAVRKINLNEFLMSLKSADKAANSGSEEEDVFCVPSQASEDTTQSSAGFVYSHQPLDICNVTKVFREHEDGMEMTKCLSVDAKTVFSAVDEAPAWCGDVTEAFVDDGMDMTISHTARMSFPFSTAGNQSLNFQKDSPATELDNSILKRASNQHLTVQHNPQLCTDKNPVSVEGRREPAGLRAVKQEARTMSAIPGSISSETVFRDDQTLPSSKDDDMDITGNYTEMIHNDSTKEMKSSHHKTCEKPVNANSLLARGDRDSTRSLSSSDNRAPVSHTTRALELSLGSEEQVQRMTQDHSTTSASAGFDPCTTSASAGVSQSRLQHRLNPQLASVPSEKTVLFSGEDMDLTKTSVIKDDGKNDESESPAGLFTSATCKPHFLHNRATSSNLNEQEEMEITKCHAVNIDDQHNRITVEAKQMPCEIIPRKNQKKDISEDANNLDKDKENIEVIGISGNVKRSQAIEMSAKDLEVKMVDKRLGKTNFQASGPSSCAKSFCSLQEQRQEVPGNRVTDTSAFVPLQSQKAVKSQLLEKNLLNPSVSCTNDEVFSDDQNMDITETLPAAFDAASLTPVQECKNNHHQSNVMSRQLQTQSSGVSVTSQTVAMECGDWRMKTNKPSVTPWAPNGSSVSRNEMGMKGSTQPGTISGINTDCQNSDRQEKTHVMKVVNKTLPAPERGFSIGGTASSEEAFKAPLSADGLSLSGANLPEAHKGGSQLPLALEKSVVFPSGESMDLTGNCVVSDYRVNVPLSERKAVPGYQDENKTTSLKRGVRVTVKSQEQPVHDVYSFGKKMLPLSGLKPLPYAGEKTTLFSEDADMDITRSHTVSAVHKITLQHKSANDETAFISGDKTYVCNDDMEISRVNTVAIDKPVEKVVSQGMLITAKRTGRKSLKAATGEKTLLFSLSNENNDMEITESHTAAIGHEIVSQNKGRLSSVSSADPVNTVLFSSSQADMDITKSYSAVREEELTSEKETGQQALPNSKAATRFAVEDVDITKTHHITLEEKSLQGWRPSTSTVMFTSLQADMEMTQSLSGGGGTGRVFCEERLKQVGQEAVSASRTIVFPSAEDMEVTRTHTAVLSGAMGVQDRESMPAAPADKTVMFSHNRDDMEITASHTTALNDVRSLGKKEWSWKSTQQPGLVLPSWRGEIDSSHTKHLNSEYQTNFEPKASIASASSASAFPGDKGAIQVPSVTTPDPVYSASIPEETVRAPQDLDTPTDDSVPVSSQQDLLPPENLTSQRASSKLPSKGPRNPSEEGGNLVSQVSLPIQQADPLSGTPDARSTQRNQVLKGESARPEDLATDLGLTGASLVPVSNKESEESEMLPAEGETAPKDLKTISEQTKQLSVSDKQRDQVDPTLAPEISGISNVWSKLQNIRRKSAVFSVPEPAFADQLPTSSLQPEGTLRLGKDAVKEAEQEKTSLESGAAPLDATAGMALENKFQGIRIPIGIFQPKLPSRQKPSVASVQDTHTKSSSDKGEAAVSEEGVNAGETPGTSKSARQHFSPSQFIAEEFLPVCLEEMDSNESVSSELMENVYSESSKKEISHNETNQLEKTKTCSNTKRALEQDEEPLQSPKKVKGDENLDGEASQDLQVPCDTVSGSQVKVHEGEDPPNLSAKSPDCTHASTSSSLDSGKADTELTIQRSSHMESWLLTDSICEDTLREKLESGAITVGEFLTLLQVHVPIQKPRYSQIPTSCAVSAAPTAEDLLYSQYVYRPKLRIYEEDCKALSQKIDELKEYVDSVQDQLLVNVNKSLWEVMTSCSDEELKNFGAELNKMKSCFTMESKILAHNEKAALYSKLLHSVQDQQEKLQSRIEKVDEVLKEAESCLAALEADSGWDGCEAGCSGEVAGGKSLERELATIKAQEEELQRELTALEIKNEQMLTRMNQLKEEENYYQELLEKCSFAEWDMTEWSEKQAVFSFLYDSVELTVVFGPPIDGDEFGEDPSRTIVSLNFESLLDEEAAPPSSCLVLKLIFQFIESQGCWQEKYPTLYHLPQVLHNLSSVVSHCKTLGEEIEFLERWGGKFNLLETDPSDTRVRLLFSSSIAFAKFELTLSLSASYPSAPLPFTVHKRIGNIGEEEVSAVLSRVPVGHHYLRRIVSSIHQHLLQAPR